jgi:ABC-2 type transport system permease protein
MRNFLRIAKWEYSTRFKSRSFLFSTFVLPVLFLLLITLPVLFISLDSEVSTKLYGIINMADKTYTDKLQEFLNNNYKLKNNSPEYVIYPISVDNSINYNNAYNEFIAVKSRRDSLSVALGEIKKLRSRYLFTPKSEFPNKEYMMNKTYKEMRIIREEKDIAEIELVDYNARLDSIYEREARIAADSLLFNRVLDAYLFFPEDLLKENKLEFHTRAPGGLLEAERIQKIISEIIIQIRMQGEDISNKQIAQWLKPISLKKYQLRAKNQYEWNFYLVYYGAVIGVILLFMAIFTSGGFLFSSVIQEKSNRVIEILLSYASSKQIMAGKIFGLGFLGLTQVLIWLIITGIFVVFNLFNAGQIPYLNLENAMYFILYFYLGYLLYASVFVAIGSIFNSEQDAQHITIVLRTFAIFPVLLVFLFLKEPNSYIITLLSYFPLFTPYFMIMRIFISSAIMTTEIYFTIGILLISIVGMVFIAARIFRITILMYGKKLSWKEVYTLLKVS